MRSKVRSRYTETALEIYVDRPMTLKDILLQELETADEQMIAETIDWVRSRKQTPSTKSPSGEPIRRGNKLGDLAEFAGTWAGDDLEDCLEMVYATRSKSHALKRVKSWLAL